MTKLKGPGNVTSKSPMEKKLVRWAPPLRKKSVWPIKRELITSKRLHPESFFEEKAG